MHNPDVSILFIEDDEIVRDILCSFIGAKYAGVATYSAGSSEEGLILFGKYRQSIIITDINLDGSDGIEMVRSIRALAPDTVIIFVSGCSSVERLKEFEGPAPCHFICKPLNHEDLFALLDRYVKKLPSPR